MYFHEYVAVALRDVCDVTRVPDNGKTSSHILQNFEAWVPPVRPDVIYLNCGLHDIARSEANGWELATPIDRYEANVREIVGQIRATTHAQIVWGTTTPVMDEWHLRVKKFARRRSDVQAYNVVASQVMRELGVPSVDLYALVAEAGPERLLGADGVHFLESGSALLGERVAQSVTELLGARSVPVG